MINFGCIKFRKICKFPEKSTVRGGRYFLILQPKDTLNCSHSNESQPIYSYEHYGCENDVPAFLANRNHVSR